MSLQVATAPTNNQTLTGVGNADGSQFTGFAPAAAPAVTPAAPPATPTGGTTGGLTPTPAYTQGIQQEYGAQINAAPTNMAILNQGNAAAQNAAITNTGAQEGTFQTQANAQNATLGNAINSQQNQQQLSLAELADQIRGQHQGLMAQLGATGAGSSSASGLGDVALAHEQNTNRANIDQQANAGITNAQTQEAGVNAVLKSNTDTLEVAKQNQLNTISNNYAQLMSQLQVALQTAQGEEKRALGLYGQQLTSSALQSLSDLDNSIKSNTQGLLTQGAQGATGLKDIPTAQAVAPITSRPISPFTTSTPAGNATAAPAGGSLASLLQQQQNGQQA